MSTRSGMSQYTIWEMGLTLRNQKGSVYSEMHILPTCISLFPPKYYSILLIFQRVDGSSPDPCIDDGKIE